MSQRVKQAVLRQVLPKPIETRHAEYSMLFSADDDPARPSARLIDVALAAIAAARDIRLEELHRRSRSPVDFINLWPGEHYRLLAAFVKVLQPKTVIEIGTGGGGAALAMKELLPAGGQVTTFDIIPWHRVRETAIQESDFTDGRFAQHLDDVTQAAGLEKHRALFERADFIFIDAAKDGRMETRLMQLFQTFPFKPSALFAFDDIRLWNMLVVWRSLRWPKLDLTSFGHWTGTGLAEPARIG